MSSIITPRYTVPMSQMFLDDTGETPLVIVRRTFNATPEAVWEAWTNPDLIKQWWGPETFTCPFAKIDMSKGGKFLFCMESPEGEKNWSTGTFLEIDAHDLLVCSNYPSNEKGEVVSSASVMDGPFAILGESYITVEFSGERGKTFLTLSHARLPARMHDECVKGWASSLKKLATLVERH